MRIVGRGLTGAVFSMMALAACSSEPTEALPEAKELAAARLPDPGALVDLSMDSRVGVLLDEIPESIRDRVAADMLAKPRSFWEQRAQRQVALATYRLVFRQYFYGGSQHKQLPLPPESQRKVALLGDPQRVRDAKHDTIVVSYRFTGTLLTDAASPGTSERSLENVGGTWDEPFMLPVDPELLFQRTRYACMDEEDFPPGSVDSEEVDSFYDQDCKDEKTLSRFGQCHSTERPFRSCRQAVVDAVGAVDTTMRFTRRRWDSSVAEGVRVSRMLPTHKGADLQVVASELEAHRVTYKYIEPNACELKEEKCVTGSGWRRLLQFATSDENIGNRAIEIGDVNYYLSGQKTLNETYNIFEYSSCHEHYHFTHYGSFSLGTDATTSKKGFCLQSTDRFSNHELSPLHNPYAGCGYQGIEVGWVDQYKAGLPCQWIDITDIDTSRAPAKMPLTFSSNPDGFLCEGTPVLDPKGRPVFEETEFRTASGATVFRPKCEYTPDHASNNVHSSDVVLPVPGEGMITQPCARGQIGPMRNCGFTRTAQRFTCQVGQVQRMHCELQGSGPPQVLRLCDYSRTLGTGIPCKYEDSVHSVAVEATTAGGIDIAFECPAARGADEPGGTVSVYTAPVVDGDRKVDITCAPLP